MRTGRLWLFAAFLGVFFNIQGSAIYAESRSSASGILVGGFEAPEETISLQPGDVQHVQVAFIGFKSFRFDPTICDAWLQLIEHDLLYRPGYAGKYSIQNRVEMLQLIRRELPGKKLDPLIIPRLKDLLSVDILIFIDERLVGRDWIWRVRLFNGRSGAFLADASAPYTPYHLKWMINRLIQKIHRLVYPNTDKTGIDETPPTEMLFEESVSRLPWINKDCLRDRCLERIEDFEWIQEHNPDFLASLLKNPLYGSALMKEATDPLLLARIHFIEGHPLDSSYTLEKYLGKIKKTAEKLRYLILNGKAVLELNRLEALGETLKSLEKYRSKDPFLFFGQGWLAKKNRDFDEAVTAFKKVIKNKPKDLRTLVLLLECYLEMKNFDAAWDMRRVLTDNYYETGDHVKSNALCMELLDHDFQMDLLERLVLPLLSEMDRKNLATMLNQQNIEHSENQGEINRYLATLKILEKKHDQAKRIISGTLKHFDPNNAKLLKLAAWNALARENNPVGAQNFLERIHESERDPYLSAWILEELGRYSEAQELWRETEWPTEWKQEVLLRKAALFEKMGEMDTAVDMARKALDLYRGREEAYFLLSRAYVRSGKTEAGRNAEITGWQLAGKPRDWGKFKEHIYYSDYIHLVLPHPLVGETEKGRLKSVGRVLVLDGSPTPPRGFLDKLSDFFKPYYIRERGRLIDEMKEILATRYDLLENEPVENEFAKKLALNSPNYHAKYSIKDLIGLANAVQVDSIFILKYLDLPQIQDGILETTVSLYFYDGVSGTMYMTQLDRNLPFFHIYKFNRIYLLAPVIVLFFLIAVYRRFRRMTIHWRNPLQAAEFHMNQKNFKKAAEILGKHGYAEDYQAASAHAFASQGEYTKAMEAFSRARDFENALKLVSMCPDTDDANNLIGDLYFMLKEYDRAETHYRRSRNFIGIAKIYEASGHPKRAARIMGQYYFEANHPGAAVEEYKRIGDYNRAGVVSFFYGQYKEAEEMFHRAHNEPMYKKCKLRLKQRQ